MLLHVADHLFACVGEGSFLPLILAVVAEGAMGFADVGEIKCHVFNKVYVLAVLPQIGLVG
ncbi:hypothetical protein D3C72_2133960 [compost metagenome]